MENLTDVLLNKRNEIKKEIEELIKKLKEIEELIEELRSIESIESKIKNSKIELGDYIIYDKDEPKIAEIYIDEDELYRVVYPQFKEISCETFDTLRELYDAWSSSHSFVDFISIEKDRVSSLEHGKLYFIYKKCNDLVEWKIIKIDIEQDIAIAYNVKDESDIIQADSLEILYINLLEEYEYIAEVHEDKK